MKLPLREAECDAMLAELAKWEGYVSSALLSVEAIRACGRYGGGYAADARLFLEGVALIPLGDSVLDHAASLVPNGLRSLDALHLATALSIHAEVGAFVTYGRGLADAATEEGLTVLSPV